MAVVAAANATFSILWFEVPRRTDLNFIAFSLNSVLNIIVVALKQILYSRLTDNATFNRLGGMLDVNAFAKFPI